MPRVWQGILISSMLLGSWLGMQAIHELGHVLGAWLAGGSVENVVLHPLTISRTDVRESPHPLLVTWAGPIVGAAAPMLAWLLALLMNVPGRFLLRFFAGFCLIANGAYLGFGSFEGIGDCGDLLRSGAAAWQLWLFGSVTMPLGFWLWSGLGAEFGIGRNAKPVQWEPAVVTLIATLMLFAVALWVGD